MYEEYSLHDVAVYGGYIDDDAKLMQSASGGIATALAEYILEQGGYVAGVAYSQDFYKAEYIIIHDSLDIKRLKGSKYIDCDKNNIYAEVSKLLEKGETVLFFGLPCTVAALYKFLGARPENLLTCELVCHGPTQSSVHYDYVKFLEKKYKSKVIDFSARFKADSWTPSYLYAKFENGKTFKKPFYETEYGYAFSILGKPSCYACKFKGNNRQGDIMIGDYWGATENDVFWNSRGVSSIFAETDKGDAVITALPGIKLFPTSFEKAVEKNPMVIKSKERSPKRAAFEKLLSENGLVYAVNHSLSFKSKVKKALFAILPNSVKPLAKKIISTLKSRL